MSKETGNGEVMRDVLVDVYNILETLTSFSLGLKGGVRRMREFNHLVCLAKRRINIALSSQSRNCDKFRDVDVAYDQFMMYVKRENPSFTKASPLHTVYDALKWVLDSKRKEAGT